MNCTTPAEVYKMSGTENITTVMNCSNAMCTFCVCVWSDGGRVKFLPDELVNAQSHFVK